MVPSTTTKAAHGLVNVSSGPHRRDDHDRSDPSNHLSHGTWGLSERPDLTGWTNASLLLLHGQPVAYTDLNGGDRPTFHHAYARLRGLSDSDTYRPPLCITSTLLPSFDDAAADHRILERVQRFAKFDRRLRFHERGRDWGRQVSRGACADTAHAEGFDAEMVRRGGWPEARTVTEAFRGMDMAASREERVHWVEEVLRLWNEERAGRAR